MGERYRAWLDDPRSRTVLEGLGGLNLGEVEQAVLETAVRYYASRRRYTGAVGALAPSVGSRANASALIDGLSIVTEGERRGGLRRLGEKTKANR